MYDSSELDDFIKNGNYRTPDLIKLRTRISNSSVATREADLATVDKLIMEMPDKEHSKKLMQKVEAIHKVAVVVKELIGDRSIRRTAEETGVAASYITGILKERYLPSAEILRKLASSDSKPQNGVLLEDLMIAAGYQNQYADETAVDLEYNEFEEQDIDKINEAWSASDEVARRPMAHRGRLRNATMSLDEYEESRRLQRRALHQMRARFEKVAKGIIYQELVEKGVFFKNVEEPNVGIRGFRPDAVVELSHQPIDEWWFDFRLLTGVEDRPQVINRGVMNVRNILGRYIFIEPKPRRKISVVINSIEEFDIWKGYIDKLSFRGDLSVILVDVENYTLIDEVYLAHYDVDSNASELKICK